MIVKDDKVEMNEDREELEVHEQELLGNARINIKIKSAKLFAIEIHNS